MQDLALLSAKRDFQGWWISLAKLLAISNLPRWVTAPQIGHSRARDGQPSFTPKSESRNCRVQHRRPRAGAVLRHFPDLLRHSHAGQHRQMEVNEYEAVSVGNSALVRPDLIRCAG